MSQGSRESARNTNDLFTRWLTRRGAELPPIIDNLPKTVRLEEGYEKPLSEQQARQQLEYITNKIRAIDTQINDLVGLSLRTKRHLRKEKDELIRAARLPKAFITEWGKMSCTDNLKKLVDSRDPELFELADFVLKDRMRPRTKTPPPIEQMTQVWKKRDIIQDALMTRKLNGEDLFLPDKRRDNI